MNQVREFFVVKSALTKFLKKQNLKLSVRNMSIIPIVDKNRSLSVKVDTNINRQISEIDKSRSQNFLWLSILIDFWC